MARFSISLIFIVLAACLVNAAPMPLAKVEEANLVVTFFDSDTTAAGTATSPASRSVATISGSASSRNAKPSVSSISSTRSASISGSASVAATTSASTSSKVSGSAVSSAASNTASSVSSGASRTVTGSSSNAASSVKPTTSGSSTSAGNQAKPTPAKTTSLQCNIARAVIITDLEETAALIEQIDTSDSKFASAVSTAQDGVKAAGQGIRKILTALIAGDAPPGEFRDEVGKGLSATFAALSGLDSTDGAVTMAFGKLNDTIAAGDEVVAVCR